jgi:hypothetical protein
MKRMLSIALLTVSFSAFAENSKFFEEQRIPAAVAFIKCEHGKECEDFNEFVTHFNDQPKTDRDVLQLIRDQSYINAVLEELKKRKSGLLYSKPVTSEELGYFIDLLQNNINRQEDFRNGTEAWLTAHYILRQCEEARQIAQSKAKLACQVAQAKNDMVKESAESK